MLPAPRRCARLFGARSRLAPLLLLAALAAPVGAQQMTPAGLWQTVSDVDGKPKGHVRIREVQGEFLGVIEKVLDPDKQNERCEDCPGERHNLPVLGLTIIDGVHRDGEIFDGGHILDPDNGRVYKVKLTLIDGGKRLDVRGYIGFSLIGRTQTWNRLE